MGINYQITTQQNIRIVEKWGNKRECNNSYISTLPYTLSFVVNPSYAIKQISSDVAFSFAISQSERPLFLDIVYISISLYLSVKGP